MPEVYLRNRQRSRPVNLRLLRNIAKSVVRKTFPADGFIGILLVGSHEITRINERFLKHAGSTDVIAFSYGKEGDSLLHAEIFICVDEAVCQARRFRTAWQKEVARYLIHGLLHLQGHEDSTPVKRARMKAVEDLLLRQVARQFRLSELSRKARVGP